MGGVLSPGSLRRAQPFPESALRPVPPLRLSRTLEPPPPTRALSSACQFPASPESILPSPVYPLPFLLLSLGEPGQPLPRSPSDRRRPYPRQRHGPDSANSFSGASPGAARPGLVRAVERVVRRRKLESGPKQRAGSEVGGGIGVWGRWWMSALSWKA